MRIKYTLVPYSDLVSYFIDNPKKRQSMHVLLSQTYLQQYQDLWSYFNINTLEELYNKSGTIVAHTVASLISDSEYYGHPFKGHILLLHKDNDEIIGYTSFIKVKYHLRFDDLFETKDKTQFVVTNQYYNKDTVYYINGVGILADMQGHGLCQKILDKTVETITKIVRNKKPTIFLAVLNDNYSAIRCYKKRGFKSISGVLERNDNGLTDHSGGYSVFGYKYKPIYVDIKTGRKVDKNIVEIKEKYYVTDY